jgi:formamidopyrimidine-DNA glycosylase
MPELPEVETIRQDLRSKILNKKILAFEVLAAKSFRGRTSKEGKELVGNALVEIERTGKLLIFVLKRPIGKKQYLLLHLKMTGQLIYTDKNSRKLSAGGHSDGGAKLDELPNKFTRAIFSFEGGFKLFFNDLRRFGYIALADDKELAKIRSKFGPEPLTQSFILPVFQKAISGRKKSIKAVLLDQQIIAGLGNIYVDESLFAAGIRPERRSDSLKLEEIKRLFIEINRILALAVEQRGTTFNNYVDSDGKKGNFSKFLKVYGRGKEKCLSCNRPLIKTKVAGRGTHYCAFCQK